MARSLKFRIKKVEGLYYPCSENKGADQLRGYHEADLRLCFRICKNLVFSRHGSYLQDKNGFLTDSACLRYSIQRYINGIKSRPVYFLLFSIMYVSLAFEKMVSGSFESSKTQTSRPALVLKFQMQK